MSNFDTTIPYNPAVKRVTHNFRILTSRQFGRLRVVAFWGIRKSRGYWLCQCSCGQWKIAQSSFLLNGHTGSCGCLNIERIRSAHITHGEAARMYPTPEYRAYCTAKGRCNNPSDAAFSRYGGRGIEFRFESFDEFLAEIGRKPTAKHSLDRINVNGHYETNNVRWATDVEQNRNRRDNKWITVRGISQTESAWSKALGAKGGFVNNRIKHGWCVDCSVTIPINGRASRQSCPHRPPTDRWTTRWANMAKGR